MAAPRVGKFNTNTSITYSDGTTKFNGFFLIGTTIPTLSGTAFAACFYGNSGVSERLPQFYKVPVDDGIPNASCGLFYNADINPPGSTYVYWTYVGGTSGVPARMIAGPSSSFTVSSATITLPSLTLTLPSAGSAPDPDTSTTASTPVTTVVTLDLASPVETPNGSETEFTFESIPQVVIYNGVWQFENVGYSRAGSVVTLLDADGNPFAPETGASIKAIL